MCFIELYDDSLTIELIMFSDIYEKYKNYINQNELFVVYCNITNRNNKVSVIVNKMERLGKC